MYANITVGFHRGNEVKGIFEVHKAFSNGKMSVKAAPGTFGNTVPTPRVQLDEAGFTYCNKDGGEIDMSKMLSTNPLAKEIGASNADATDYEQEFISHESEDDAMDRIQHTFQMLETVATASVNGIVRGLVVSGPPGIGKSHGVEQVLKGNDVINALAGKEPNYTVVSGASSAIGLYQTLYFYRQSNATVLFDDCDSVLFDELSLNLLKAALDSGKKRRICWNTESRVLRENDIPNHFDFEGSVIFLTNLNFERTKASKIADHLKAIMSRCHYLDLEIGNQRDLLLRVKQVVRDGMLASYDFNKQEEHDLLAYFFDNADYLREISLRMVTKLADLVKMQPGNWREFAEATCLKRDAKFKRLRQQQVDNLAETTSKLPA